MENAQNELMVIFTAVTARKLIKMGFAVQDIKPDREDPKRTIFYFKNSEPLRNVLEGLRKDE
jgi:hypothetical protein